VRSCALLAILRDFAWSFWLQRGIVSCCLAFCFVFITLTIELKVYFKRITEIANFRNIKGLRYH